MKFSEPENRNWFPTGTTVSDSKTWIFSLIGQMRDFVREWRVPSPRVQVTATPIEVQELWSRNQNHIPGLVSLLGHALVVMLLLLSSIASYLKPKSIADTSLIPAPFRLSLPLSNDRLGGGGGGGGMRAPTPASQGVLPRAAAFQLVPPTPLIVNMNPELAAVPTIIDLVLPKITDRNVILQMGDPNGVSGPPSGGPGSNQGIGGGNDHGIGDGNGPFPPGPGTGPGGGPVPGIVAIGKGGATPPSCPIPSTEPEYTDDARKARIQGTVVMDVVVNRDGTVTVNGFVQRLGYGLDDEASRFVAKNFKCRAGVYQGQPVATPVRINMNFHLY